MSCTKDHPRIRGEKRSYRIRDFLERGSPPHTRGKDVSKIDKVKSQRITPAYAGKSIGDSRSFSSHQDHPRIRGEKRMRLR